MEKRRKKFLAEYTNYQEVRELFKRIITLPFIDTMFIKDVFNKIKRDTEDLPNCIKEFILYFEHQFIEHYPLQYWSYFKQYTLRTNN